MSPLKQIRVLHGNGITRLKQLFKDESTETKSMKFHINIRKLKQLFKDESTETCLGYSKKAFPFVEATV